MSCLKWGKAKNSNEKMNHVSRDCTCQHQCRKKKLNQNIKMSIVFFSFQGRPLWLVSFFTRVFKVWERIFLQFLSKQVKHQHARNKIWRQYFLEIRVDGQQYDNQTSKKVKNIENSYNSRWKRNERFSINDRDSREAQCPFHD